MSYCRTALCVETAVESDGPFSALTAKISGLLNRDQMTRTLTTKHRRRDGAGAFGRTQRAAGQENGGEQVGWGTARNRSGRPVKRTQPSSSRHTRPPETEIIEPVAERPRRPRSARRTTDPTIPPAEPRAARGRRRPASPASSRRPASAGLRTNGPIGTAGSTASEPFEPHGAQRERPAQRHASPDLAGARTAPTTTRVRSIAPARARLHQAEAWEYDV